MRLHPCSCTYRRSQDFLCGALFFSEKVDDLVLVVALKTEAKSTKLTTPTVQISPISPKNGLLLWLRGVLEIFHCKFGQIKLLSASCAPLGPYGARKLRGCTFSEKKLTTFFIRRPQNLSTPSSGVPIFGVFEAHCTLLIERTVSQQSQFFPLKKSYIRRLAVASLGEAAVADRPCWHPPGGDNGMKKIVAEFTKNSGQTRSDR